MNMKNSLGKIHNAMNISIVHNVFKDCLCTHFGYFARCWLTFWIFFFTEKFDEGFVFFFHMNLLRLEWMDRNAIIKWTSDDAHENNHHCKSMKFLKEIYLRWRGLVYWSSELREDVSLLRPMYLSRFARAFFRSSRRRLSSWTNSNTSFTLCRTRTTNIAAMILKEDILFIPWSLFCSSW